jgi:hypothetical protein
MNQEISQKQGKEKALLSSFLARVVLLMNDR